MDRVYAGADLTLVAAAGEDAQFGLPGVSTRPRSSRQSLKLGNYILSTYWDPKLLQKHVERSKWMQRGWTFQEALLSKKRIFFTEYCYLYDCKTCCSRGYELDRLETGNPPSRLRLEHRSWMPYSSFEEAGQFYARVREFSKRTLTYQSDALNAMAGIFRRFENLQHPVHNFWGVPIVHPESSASSRSRVTTMDSFVRGLACSVSKAGGRRRVGFPSWSWAGWEAACHPLHYWGSAEPTAVRVEIELRCGNRINWPEFEARCFLKQEPSHVSNHIWINAWTFQVAGFECRQSRGQCWAVPIAAGVSLSYYHFAGNEAAVLSKCHNGKLMAVILGDINAPLGPGEIILTEEHLHGYERIGHFHRTIGDGWMRVHPCIWTSGFLKLERRWVRLS